MDDPSYRAFCAFLWRRGNIWMFEDSFRHMSKPAPDHTDIGWSHPKGILEEQRPKIKSESCAKPNDD
jgi:hypothetical protein